MKKQTSEELLERDIARKARKTIKNENDDIVYTSFLETKKSLIEQISSPIEFNSATVATVATVATDTKFLVFDKLTGSIDYLDELIYDGKTYRPIIDESLLSGAVLLPSGIEEYGSDADLVKEIYDFLYENFEVPKIFQRFLPYIIMFSWVSQKFPFVPYIHFVGLTSTGKTTAAEALSSICYKTCDASGSITMASIFRMAHTWRGTLFLDEFEPSSDNYSEMIAFLKAGVGNRVILRTEGDKKREVKAYIIKAMKIFTSEQPISSAGLRSRMYVIEMQKTHRRIPLIKQNRFYEQAQYIRNKLLLWRLRHYGEINLSAIEFGYPELAAFDRRVQQVLTPIYYLSDEKSRTEILEFAKIQEEETKRERLESLEGEIFQSIMSFQPNDPTVKQITESINTDRSRRQIRETKIGTIIRHVLLFDIERIGHENTRTILVNNNPERVAELCDYYGVSVPPAQTVATVANGISASEHDKNATVLNPATILKQEIDEFPLLNDEGIDDIN